jgi:hypothetical protein
MSEKEVKRRWTAVPVDPPVLTDLQWGVAGLVGLVLILMAVAQILSIKDFEENFALQGFTETRLLSVIVILAELWAAAGLFKIRLSRLFRKVSNGAALLVGLFWFSWTAYSVTGLIHYSGNFFGRFAGQLPGWVTIIETLVVVWLITYLVSTMHNNSAKVLPVVTRTNKRDLKKRR